MVNPTGIEPVHLWGGILAFSRRADQYKRAKMSSKGDVMLASLREASPTGMSEPARALITATDWGGIEE